MTRGAGTTPPEQGVALAPGAATTFESVSSRPSGLGRLLGATALPTTAPRPPQTRQLRVVGVVILSSQGDAEIEPGEGALVESGLVVVLRRRRRDLAVMQAVGFSGRQVLGSVGVQATTIALVGLVAGIPLGLAIGRTGWRLTATALGVAAPPALPWLGLITISLLTVLAVNLLALGPG